MLRETTRNRQRVCGFFMSAMHEAQTCLEAAVRKKNVTEIETN